MTKRADYPRPVRLIAGAIFCALLMGCGYEADTLGLTQKQIEDQAIFVAVPASQAWANPPGMTFVLERGLLGGSEQRIGLQNYVAMPGDNLLVLRTRSGHLAAARFRFEEFMTRVEGPPVPFTGLSSGDLMAETDGLGTYFWAEELVGTSVTCVFAIRRLTDSARALPQEARVMDVMLRNCISGSREEALAPINDLSLRFAATTGGTVSGGARMLSPLAAPGLE